MHDKYGDIDLKELSLRLGCHFCVMSWDLCIQYLPDFASSWFRRLAQSYPKPPTPARTFLAQAY